VGVSLAVALLPSTVPVLFKDHMNAELSSLLNSGVTLGASTAILLNLVLNRLGPKKPQSEPAVAGSVVTGVDQADAAPAHPAPAPAGVAAQVAPTGAAGPSVDKPDGA
jgi:uric acid transporter